MVWTASRTYRAGLVGLAEEVHRGGPTCSVAVHKNYSKHARMVCSLRLKVLC